MLDAKPTIEIEVPSGPQKQQFSAIFKRPNWPPDLAPMPFGIMLHESLLPEVLMDKVALHAKNLTIWGGEKGRWFHCKSRHVQPRVSIRDANGELMSVYQTARLLSDLTTGFELIGLGLDQFTRYVPKRLICAYKDDVPTLIGVQFRWTDLIAASLEPWGA